MIELLLVCIAALGVGILSLQHPRVATVFVVVAIPFYWWRVLIGPFNPTIVEVFLVGAVLGRVVAGAWWSDVKMVIADLPAWFLVSAILFLLGVAGGLISSLDVVGSSKLAFSLVVVPIIVAGLVRRFLSVRVVVASLLISSVGSALVAMAFGATAGGRLVGMYDTPVSMALWMSPLSAASWWLAAQLGSRWLGIAAAVLTVALLWSGSLAGVAASGVGLVLAAVRWHQARLLAISLLGLLCAAVIMLGMGRVQYHLQALDKEVHTSGTVRVQLWQVSVELAQAHPLWGIGLGQFEGAYQEILAEWSRQGRFIIPEFVLRDPHNWILSMWLNVGILGWLGFVGLHGALLQRQRGSYRQAVWLAVVVLVVHGLVDTIYWKNDLALLHWVFLATIASKGCQSGHVGSRQIEG